MKIFFCLVSLLFNFLIKFSKSENDEQRLSIGIPVMKITDENLLKHKPELRGKSYIAASYVKFVELAGSRAVAITPNLSDNQLNTIFNSINGLLFPGGNVNLVDSKYYYLTKRLAEMASKLNDEGIHFPILGICRGMQALVKHSKELMVPTDSQNFTSSLKWHKESPLFRNSFYLIKKDTELYNITSHFHQYSFLPTISINTTFDVIATSIDRKGKEFVSIIQDRTLPFYGVQFHPEKILFEWAPTIAIPHNSKAVRFSQSIANGFMDEARKNNHSFKSYLDENNFTLVRQNPIYIGDFLDSHSPFVQIYTFP
ncbi:gamma-glutamyl hydrolase [Hydra vulgaris]|uniref:gamma-glutamyl hydrolase n=1 Tax=Hydra vulgaris TaxID=6087 RepID=UPI001F5F22E3|nr:gamma-glutamyl hydrolase [Hydra vulgaris]